MNVCANCNFMFCYGRGNRWLHPCACVWLWHACTCGECVAPRPLWCRELLTFASKLGCTSVNVHFTSFSYIVSLLPTFPLPQTGPKGVLSDYRRFEQVQKQEADHEKQEQLEQIQREAVTCRSAVSERRLDSVHTTLCTTGLGWADVYRVAAAKEQ